MWTELARYLFSFETRRIFALDKRKNTPRLPCFFLGLVLTTSFTVAVSATSAHELNMTPRCNAKNVGNFCLNQLRYKFAQVTVGSGKNCWHTVKGRLQPRWQERQSFGFRDDLVPVRICLIIGESGCYMDLLSPIHYESRKIAVMSMPF